MHFKHVEWWYNYRMNLSTVSKSFVLKKGTTKQAENNFLLNSSWSRTKVTNKRVECGTEKSFFLPLFFLLYTKLSGFVIFLLYRLEWERSSRVDWGNIFHHFHHNSTGYKSNETIKIEQFFALFKVGYEVS